MVILLFFLASQRGLRNESLESTRCHAHVDSDFDFDTSLSLTCLLNPYYTHGDTYEVDSAYINTIFIILHSFRFRLVRRYECNNVEGMIHAMIFEFYFVSMTKYTSGMYKILYLYSRRERV